MPNKKSESRFDFLKSKEIRDKLFFSLVILVVFRALATVPVVGIPAEALKQLFAGSSFGELMSTLSGGVLESASIVAIGLSPYINASVMLQLLTSVIPKLEQLRQEGSEGRRKISLYTRYLTVPLAILQSFVIYSTLRGFGLMGQLESLELITMSATLTAGSMIMMWFGELISESGLGGGSSYIIFLGIIAGIPGTLQSNMQTMDPAQKIILILITVALVGIVVLITEAERRIKVQYSRRVRTGGSFESFIPLKLTQAGVMPVIFAISLLSFPQLIGQFLVSRNINENITNFATKAIDLLGNQYFQNIGTFVLVIAFSFFYVTVVFNTDELSENLQKQGAFIPGIRPGVNTSKHLRAISFRLTAVGATILAFLAVLPNLLISTGIVRTSIMSGTGILIVVGVVLEMKRQIESMVVVRSYDKYM